MEKKKSFSKEVRSHKRILYDLFVTIENLITGNSFVTRAYKDGCIKYEISIPSNYLKVLLTYEETTSERGVYRNNNSSKELKEESPSTETVKPNEQTTNINMKKLKVNISNPEISKQYSFPLVSKSDVNLRRIIYDLFVTIENIIIGASSVTRDVIDGIIMFKIKSHQPTVTFLYDLSPESEHNSVLQLIGDQEKHIMKNKPYITRQLSRESCFANMNMTIRRATTQPEETEPLNLISVENFTIKQDKNNPGMKTSSQELATTITLEYEREKTDFTDNKQLYIKKLCKIKTEPSTFESEKTLINVKSMNSNDKTEKGAIDHRNMKLNKMHWKTFRDMSTKAIYERGMYTGEKLYKCEYCEKTFDRSSNKISHERTHTGEKPFKCDYCKNRFSQLSHKIIHERTHTKEKPFICDYCKKTFAQLSDKICHERLHTGEKPYKCDYCEKTFVYSSNKISHERTHTGEKPYKCEYCKNTFAQLSQKIRHERTHTGEKPYKCDYCEKAFAQSFDKIRHERLHTGEKLYKCEYCEKTFDRSSHKISHEKTHTGEKPFKCEYCKKTFAELSDKTCHERLHTREKLYKCEYCEKTFARSSNKIRHERTHTGV